MQPPGQQNQRDNDEFHGQGHPPHPFGLLNQIFNPGNGQHGDMVFSQEAFDRVISQLMEQSNSSNAPPPASEEAIRSLEKKMVDKDMLGPGGKAECSICMDDVTLNQEVTVLPCKHWFHGGCVTAWLKGHDTCPHCRKPISEHDQNQQPNASRWRYSRRASSTSSPRAPGLEGTRHNPIAIPESPNEMREARRQNYGSPRDGQFDRPETLQHSSSHDSCRHGTYCNGGRR
jgi:E3 ubiquitin-protein ligase RNF115/126